MPGFFAALFLSPWVGALVAGIGHIVTAALRGFYMTIIIHLLIGLEMAFCAYIFGWIFRKSNGIFASIVAIIVNGPVSLLIISLFSTILGLENSGWIFYGSLIIPLTIVSSANIILAYILYIVLKNVLNGEKNL